MKNGTWKRRKMEHGNVNMEHGWIIEGETCNMEHGTWIMDLGTRNMEHGTCIYTFL